MRIAISNVCGECGRAFPGLMPLEPEMPCGHSVFKACARTVDLDDAMYGVSRYAMAAAKDLAKFKAEAVERTLAGWVAKSGLTVEQFARSFSYQIQGWWEGNEYRFRITAVHARSLEPVASFSAQPTPAPAR